MKKIYPILALISSLHITVFADTWECIDSGDGHVYKATQSVPVDGCKLIAKTPESEEIKRIRALVNIPLSERATTVEIGMSKTNVLLSRWGSPEKVNRTTTARGVSEQWVYEGGRYLYFENGIVTAIEE